ncbi:MAG: protease modulator HflC [Deltaproteobacteria bacterium]|nr:protease modulator HflC [Deltaproteobacteria bacterium]
MNKKYIAGFIAFIVLVALYSCCFIVNETQQAVITRFGSPVRDTITSAGIYLKLPFVDQANFFEKRILEWDGDVVNPIPTKDKKNIIVDTTARWKITNARRFLERVSTVDMAQSRLDDIIDSNVRDIISRHRLVDIVRNTDRVLDIIKEEQATESLAVVQDQEEIIHKITLGREKITREILKNAQPIIEEYGIELIDVRIKGLMYSNAVLETVYNRMISNYGIKAQSFSSEGDKKKSQIEGKTELEIKTIRSEAYKKAQVLRGEGDAIAAKTYANALLIDPDFYHFQQSLEAYEEAINKNSSLIIGTDSEFFRVLKDGDKTSASQ